MHAMPGTPGMTPKRASPATPTRTWNTPTTTPSPASHDGHPRGRREGGGNVWLSVGRSVAERWWRRHPAHAAGQLARPLLERYARKEPAKLMAIAAATGAVLVLVKPWRLLSTTAVLAAVLKTSDVADLVTTLMQKTTSPPRKDPP
jgi:hypothetical protein